ncbi:hypothetical protein, partial [Devosia sp.]|uniref:hypothetical protein n=1 Tax=Devosia sp. TaxID=1871048 RepID=UPI0035AE51B7
MDMAKKASVNDWCDAAVPRLSRKAPQLGRIGRRMAAGTGGLPDAEEVPTRTWSSRDVKTDARGDKVP